MSAADLLSEPRDDLTSIFNDSQLPAHLHPYAYTTKSGDFSLDVDVFPGYYLAPEVATKSKRARRSWIWQYGVLLLNQISQEKRWACITCHGKGIDSSYCATSTGSATNHLNVEHKVYEAGRIQEMNTTDHYPPINTVEYRAALLEWLLLDNISFRQATSVTHNKLLRILNPRVQQEELRSGTTVSKLIKYAHAELKSSISKQLFEAASKLTLSFDLWTSKRNKDSYCGVVAHFFYKTVHHKHLLLSLPRVYGRHTGDNIATFILQAIREFNIRSKVRFFMMDNATNNDAAMTQLGRQLEIPVYGRRLRCGGHVINLVVKAGIHGKGTDLTDEAVEQMAIEESRTLMSEHDKDLEHWRQKGVVGKLHNIALHVNRSVQRGDKLREIQSNIEDLHSFYKMILNGATRWNSLYDMLQRGKHPLSNTSANVHSFRPISLCKSYLHAISRDPY